MNAARRSIKEVSYRPRRVWAARLGGSNLMACSLSVFLHAGAFVGLYRVAYREESRPHLIIPETSFAAAGAMPRAAAPAHPLTLSLDGDRPLHVDTGPIEIQMPRVADAPLDPAADVVPPIASEGLARDALTSVMPAGVATLGPASQFFGQPGNAYKIVYVVDVSASLMYYIDDIVRELRASIEALKPTQQFHVVVAKPGVVDEFEPRRLVPAIRSYKQRADAFIDSFSGPPGAGQADPVQAMQRAFAAGPELIYFLSDGDYKPDVQTELQLTVRKLNEHGRVCINTLGFDLSPKAQTFLEQLARQNGGRSRLVELKE